MNIKVKEMFNKQITYLLESAYQYLEFSYFFDSRDLYGYAKYYRLIAKEEIKHAMSIYDYLIKTKENIKLIIIHTLCEDYKTIEDVLKANLRIEKSIESNLDEIYKTTTKLSDLASKHFIKEFIDKRINLSSSIHRLIDEYELYKDNLFILDKTLERNLNHEIL